MDVNHQMTANSPLARMRFVRSIRARNRPPESSASFLLVPRETVAAAQLDRSATSYDVDDEWSLCTRSIT